MFSELQCGLAIPENKIDDTSIKVSQEVAHNPKGEVTLYVNRYSYALCSNVQACVG